MQALEAFLISTDKGDFRLMCPERPPDKTAVHISSHRRSKREFTSRADHPWLHSQSWKTWKAAGRPDDQLITGSTANQERHRKGVWDQRLRTYRASRSFTRSRTD